MPIYEFTLNQKTQVVDVDADKPLLWVLREDLGQTQAKFGCGAGLCGACSVYVGDALVRACAFPISGVGTKEVRTLSGVQDELAEALLQAWEKFDVAQCGYCQPGFVMAAHRLLQKTPIGQPLAYESISNLCRCATYERMRQAIGYVHSQRRS